jgi:rSAM/selenodomain-associated transferase 1
MLSKTDPVTGTINTENALIIFIRNPEPGKVKTRLAATIGDEKALTVYRELLRHTRQITENLPVRKLLFYADQVNLQDEWVSENYEKFLQAPGDLGLKMAAAFERAYLVGAKKVMVIGSDCYELTEALINQAFQDLVNYNAVIGPAADGGYYLLGFSRPNPTVFQNKIWSTDTVYEDTIRDLDTAGMRFKVLPVLNDVDEEKDLGMLRKLL